MNSRSTGHDHHSIGALLTLGKVHSVSDVTVQEIPGGNGQRHRYNVDHNCDITMLLHYLKCFGLIVELFGWEM